MDKPTLRMVASISRVSTRLRAAEGSCPVSGGDRVVPLALADLPDLASPARCVPREDFSVSPAQLQAGGLQ